MCFQHGVAFRDFNNLLRRTRFDKVLCDKAFSIAKTTQLGLYQPGLASMVFKCFDRKSIGGVMK